MHTSCMDEHCPAFDIDQSAYTTRRKSARSARVEIITHGGTSAVVDVGAEAPDRRRKPYP
jgi:hypothetical protein